MSDLSSRSAAAASAEGGSGELPPPSSGTVAVEVDALRKVFPSRRRDDVVAVDGVSFTIDRGEIVGLLGANGAGKTTTIKCLCGLVRPTAGTVRVNGHDVVADPRRTGAHVAAVLEGNRNLYWRMNVRENIEFFAGLQGIGLRQVRTCRDDLIERFDLGDKAKTPARMLSRGMQQKLSLACAVARQTPVLMLDEPTLGLDVETSHELRTHLRELAHERAILLSSHDMGVIQDVTDRVVVMARGRVVADDRVPNLLTAFTARAYRTVVGSLSDEQRERLAARFAALEIDATEDGATTITVEVVDSDGIYDLIDVLRRERTPIITIDRDEPDLEKVFLRLVREGSAR